jgi:hypothetical protein
LASLNADIKIEIVEEDEGGKVFEIQRLKL